MPPFQDCIRCRLPMLVPAVEELCEPFHGEERRDGGEFYFREFCLRYFTHFKNQVTFLKTSDSYQVNESIFELSTLIRADSPHGTQGFRVRVPLFFVPDEPGIHM